MNPPITPEQLVEALAEFEVQEPPRALFRFHGPTAISALRHGCLRIRPPSEFNDPFELSPGIESERLTAADLRRSFLAATSLPRQVFRPRFADEPAYAQWVENVVLGRHDLWGQHFTSMRASVASAAAMWYGIACFSAFTEAELNGPLGIRHWAMYGRDHTGFALEFDPQHGLLSSWAASKWLFPVRYYDQRPSVSIAEFDDWTEAKVTTVLRRWAEMKCRQAWGDEAEWRMICPLTPDAKNRVEISSAMIDGRKGYFLHLWKSGAPPGLREGTLAIRRVILGARIDPQVAAAVKEILSEPDFGHVKLERIELCERNFALRTVEEQR